MIEGNEEKVLFKHGVSELNSFSRKNLEMTGKVQDVKKV